MKNNNFSSKPEVKSITSVNSANSSSIASDFRSETKDIQADNSDFLAFDTSNYTCSAALYKPMDKKLFQYQKSLEVKPGYLGLRQSEAVFSHVKLLPEIINVLTTKYNPKLKAIGVSSKPRDNAESYMPCFLVGKSVAEAIASTNNINCHYFSHQAGHIVASLFSASKLKMLEDDFIAFHLSGGTTEMLFVTPDDENILQINIIGATLDISAGQVIDRVGKMLGFSFPGGKELEILALDNDKSSFRENEAISSVTEKNCSMSGIESKARQYFNSGMEKKDVARFTFNSISKTIIKMIEANSEYSDLPIVFSGGVMANTIIKNNLTEYFSDRIKLVFPTPEYARDNAGGIAILTSIKEKITGSY